MGLDYKKKYLKYKNKYLEAKKIYGGGKKDKRRVEEFVENINPDDLPEQDEKTSTEFVEGFLENLRSEKGDEATDTNSVFGLSPSSLSNLKEELQIKINSGRHKGVKMLPAKVNRLKNLLEKINTDEAIDQFFGDLKDFVVTEKAVDDNFKNMLTKLHEQHSTDGQGKSSIDNLIILLEKAKNTKNQAQILTKIREMPHNGETKEFFETIFTFPEKYITSANTSLSDRNEAKKGQVAPPPPVQDGDGEGDLKVDDKEDEEDEGKRNIKEAITQNNEEDPMNRPKQELPEQELLGRVNNMVKRINEIQKKHAISEDLIKLLADLHTKVRNCLLTGDAAARGELEEKYREAEEAAARLGLGDGQPEFRPPSPTPVPVDKSENEFWRQMGDGAQGETQQKAQQVEAQ